MKSLKHKFVNTIPERIQEGVLYVSLDYCTAVHKCVCGCGNEVVTPLSPTDWTLIFNGEKVSLDPSIGNWSFDCMSHYWIKKGKILFADNWGKSEINRGREEDMKAKELYYDKSEGRDVRVRRSFWQRILMFFKF